LRKVPGPERAQRKKKKGQTKANTGRQMSLGDSLSTFGGGVSRVVTVFSIIGTHSGEIRKSNLSLRKGLLSSVYKRTKNFKEREFLSFWG